ncbi:hypothetical protein FHR83_007041 [Actinoplanes campanulatus]|uniref:Uncharacterized protein n=1 Tax=Actinoplanes campanulatus TaxID=113559 RepID=A0A7W5ANH4_9ACTN|nr:hypothetical protein [Actinoplanes campanulatus]MBB3099335.1 hypothetical protein [Actinoplanes campanulatus]GGN40420.1 hypothetical protein GCM10010109_69510 [Actinoplanes campanulatus]GID40652.1 hypothetical protein Aca09nite_71580 [Actinoplanes campanulatus]
MSGRTPEGYEIAACRSCDAPIVWATSSGGKPMPVDAEPSEGGNVELSLQPGLWVGPVATVVSGPTLFGGTRRKAHFTTCPEVNEWRQR